MTDAADFGAASTEPDRVIPDRQKNALKLIVLTALAVVPFLPSMRGPFFWDDAANIEFNRALRSSAGLKAIWIDPLASFQYYPLTYSIFWVEFQFFGDRPFGYHAVSLALHAINALLVWKTLSVLRIPGTWWAAALFAVHPIQVETVGWITEQKNLLSTLFSLLAILGWERYIARGQSRGAAWATIAFLGALASKTVAVVLPVYLLLSEIVRRRSPSRRWLPLLLVWIAVGVTAGLLTSWRETATSLRTGSPADTPPNLRFDERVLVASQSLWRYLGLLLCLEPFVPIPVRSVPSWTNPSAVEALVGAAVVFSGLLALLKRGQPGPLLATAFFVIQLGPTLGFFPFQFQCHSFVGDHFAYFACVGVFALVCGTQFSERAAWKNGAAVFVLALLVIQTWKQSALFADPESLWSANARANPKAWAAYTNLADLQLKRQAVREALESARRAVEIEPANPMAQQNLGTALARAGRPADAERAFREALRRAPGDPRFQHNLGNVLLQQERWREAIEEYQRAAETAPDFPMTYYLMGKAYVKIGMRDEGRRSFLRALEIEPQMDTARQALDELDRESRDQSK